MKEYLQDYTNCFTKHRTIESSPWCCFSFFFFFWKKLGVKLYGEKEKKMYVNIVAPPKKYVANTMVFQERKGKDAWK